jgi:hypothetical protein
MKPESSVSYSEGPSIGLCPYPDESIPHIFTMNWNVESENSKFQNGFELLQVFNSVTAAEVIVVLL